jgi:predicted RND superfamily exporter protein
MDLAMSRNLRGVGLWALGYDQGHREFWQLLKDKYTTDTLRITDPVTYLKGYPIQVAGFFLKYADLLVTAAIVFAITMVIAMFIAFSDWRVRESFFYSQLNFYVYILVSTLLIIPLLGLIDFFDSSQIRSLFAFLTGIGIGYVIFRLSKVFQIHRP